MDHKMTQETYPSPTAPSGVSPYQNHQQDPTDDHLDLNASLQQHTQQQQQQQHQSVHGLTDQPYGNASAHMSPPGQAYQYAAATMGNFQSPMAGIAGPPQTPDDSARKKSKVTRACDECRRKKIKCDAESDVAGHPKCSNCTRTNAECKFSRAPQKRGPSKGYIKELSDRVAMLEGTGSRSDQANSPLSALSSDRKRTFDQYEQNQYSPFTAQDFSKSSFPPAPSLEVPAPASSYRAKSLGIELAVAHRSDMQPLHPVEESNVSSFLSQVNRLIPLLGSRDGINSNLLHCSKPLRKAFYFAIGAVVGTLEGSSGEQTRDQCAQTVFQMMRQGSDNIDDISSEDWDQRAYQANIVYLQTLLLCILYYQRSGPAFADPFGPATCHQLLQQANKMVEHLKLRYVTESAHLGSSPDANRVFASARRAFCVFIALDVWHSLGTRDARMIPYFSAATELTANDRTILNDPNFFEFLRRSCFAGSMSDRLHKIRNNSDGVYDAGFDSYQSLHLAFGDGAMQSPIGESAPRTTLAALAYGNVDLLCAMLYAGPVPCPATQEIVQKACKIAEMLADTDLPVQGPPLMQHFVIPAVKALTRAADYSMQRANAVVGLKAILTAVLTKGILDDSPWYNPVRQAIEDKLSDESGMRGLANAAAGEMDSENGLSSRDLSDPIVFWPGIVMEGYLKPGPL